MARDHPRFLVCSSVILLTVLVFQFSSVMSVVDEVLGLLEMASMRPSGDQWGLVSEMSGLLVRLISSPPSLETAKRSKISPPPKSCWKTIHFPSGDQTAPD